MKLEFSGHFFQKYSNVIKISPVGVELHADGQTDVHDEDKSRCAQFCERA